ncbi:unnamed protein product [Candida verbasci]|uniref:DNA excision repair protein ERCC-8 n=1 Tax=Candida verbasci TaxID=1227364 RepID=A0A9W4TZW5_9ASCO|nr:unnamed protein product [Candida verbasci]
MQSLLLERLLGNVTPLHLQSVIIDNNYSSIYQSAISNVFPLNCHKNASVNSLSLDSIDYQFLLSGCGDSSIKLWDLNQQEITGKPSEIDSKLNKNPKNYDTFDYDNPISTFTNIATIPRKTHHKFGISALQWWPYDTGMFVSSSFDHTIKIWDTNELKPVHSFNLNQRIYSIDVNGENSLISTANDHPFIRLLDLKSTSSSHTLSGHKGKTLSVKWHPINSNLLASGGLDGEVKIWDIRRSKSCLCRLDMLRTNDQVEDVYNLKKTSVKAHSGPVNGLIWDELGSILYTAGNDDKVRVWDMISKTYPPTNKLINFGPLTRNKYSQTIPILLNPKNEILTQRYLIFPSDSSDILIFRTNDGKLQTRLTRKGTKNIGRTCSMISGKPNNTQIICGTIDGEIINWLPYYEQPNIENLIEEEEEEMDIEEQILRKHKLALQGQSLMNNEV